MQKAFLGKIAAVLSVALATTALSTVTSAADPVADTPDAATTTSIAIGAGVERLPSYLGAATHKTYPVPYLDINWHDQVELSTTDGLIVDLLHREHWHGGLVGTLMWGRSTRDLGALAIRVNTLNTTLQGGTYLEYSFTKSVTAGIRWRHDVQSTGAACGDVYAEFDLPAPGFVQHSVKLDALAMNRSAMRRYFGISPEVASALGTPSYQPDGGFVSVAATYQLFIPFSKQLGISFAIDWSRLRGAAAQSPLVRQFGSRNQRTLMSAAIYNF
jgi:outer membrane protein